MNGQVLGAVLADSASLAAVDAEECLVLHRALGDVPLRLMGAGGPSSSAQRVALADQALAGQAELRERARVVRAAAFSRVMIAMTDARSRYGANELLARGSELLCSTCGLERAVLSRVEGSSWVPGPVVLASGGTFAPPEGIAIPLRGGLIEAEAVRRRQPLLVHDVAAEPRTDAWFAQWFASQSYVVVPAVVSDRVVGLVHAAAGAGRRLTSLDRDVVTAFTYELARAYEHAVLTEQHAQRRVRVREALAAVDVTLGEQVASTAAVRFARGTPSVAAVTELPSSRPAARLEGLTDRELDVLALMAQGATNLRIAVRLFVSESTVKSHVKQVLRKLSASNRAEAVYLYLRTQESVERTA